MIVGLDGQPIIKVNANMQDKALGRDISDFKPRSLSGDAAILPIFREANAKANDVARFHTAGRSALQIHVDHIVGHQWKLKYQPNWRVLGITEKQANALAYEIEAHFEDWFENPKGVCDAEEKRTGTMLARAAVMEHTQNGEIFAKSEWRKHPATGFKTAIKLVSNGRVSNPNGQRNGDRLREGVVINQHGAAQGYWVRVRHPSDDSFSSGNGQSWVLEPRYMRNGRSNFIHIFEPESPGQNRGSNTFFSAIGKINRLDKLQNATLQNAIINAMYAAVIKSDLPTEEVLSALGGEEAVKAGALDWMLGQKSAYHEAANIRLNGSRIPHLLPGEELQLLSADNPGQAFADFESSILRDIARGTNLSYESFSRDYSKTNYSSARASLLEQLKYMLGRRKVIVESFTNQIFTLWLEEAISRGVIKLPSSAPSFYQATTAWTRCRWIGSGRLMIDELKEVKAAIARLEAGLTTYEKESGNLGMDFEEILEVQNREAESLAAQGRTPLWSNNKGSSNATDEHPGTNEHGGRPG